MTELDMASFFIGVFIGAGGSLIGHVIAELWRTRRT